MFLQAKQTFFSDDSHRFLSGHFKKEEDGKQEYLDVAGAFVTYVLSGLLPELQLFCLPLGVLLVLPNNCRSRCCCCQDNDALSEEEEEEEEEEVEDNISYGEDERRRRKRVAEYAGGGKNRKRSNIEDDSEEEEKLKGIRKASGSSSTGILHQRLLRSQTTVV
jgi:hypothetical protein